MRGFHYLRHLALGASAKRDEVCRTGVVMGRVDRGRGFTEDIRGKHVRARGREVLLFDHISFPLLPRGLKQAGIRELADVVVDALARLSEATCQLG